MLVNIFNWILEDKILFLVYNNIFSFFWSIQFVLYIYAIIFSIITWMFWKLKWMLCQVASIAMLLWHSFTRLDDHYYVLKRRARKTFDMLMIIYISMNFPCLFFRTWWSVKSTAENIIMQIYRKHYFNWLQNFVVHKNI